MGNTGGIEKSWPSVAASSLRRFRVVAGSRSVRLIAFILALPLFCAGLVLAWVQSGLTADAIRFGPVAIVAAFVPVTVLLSTWQFRVLGDMTGVRIGWWRASRVVTLGTLSGLFPVSSGTVVRGGALVYWGGDVGSVGLVLALDSLVWLGLALCYSGVAALWLGVGPLGVGLCSAGILFTAISLGLAGWLGQRPGSMLALAGARLGGVIVEAVRLTAALTALGTATSFHDASVLVSASPLASLLFFLPGGLGVREAFTAVAAAAIGVSVGGAFIAAALNRLVGLSVLLLWELGLVIANAGRKGREHTATPVVAPGEEPRGD